MDRDMPHIVVKMIAGRSEDQKRAAAASLAQAMIATLGCTEASLSISIEDIAPGDWAAKVYDREIRNARNLYKTPGYEIL